MRSRPFSSWITRLKRSVNGEPPRKIWLTLDDGPEPVCTDEILATLDRHAIKATFFMIGAKIESHDAIVRRVIDAGHRIGNHSYSHPRMTEIPSTEVRLELEKTARLISRYTDGETIFRPPFGAHDERIDEIAAELGHRTILWDVDPRDWSPTFQPTAWVDNAIHMIRKGRDSVILNHDNRPSTAEHFDRFITEIKAIGSVTFEPPSTL